MLRARLANLWPFLVGGAASFVLLPVGLRTSSAAWDEVLAAAGLFVGALAVSMFAPWERLPRLAAGVPLAAAFAFAALIRDAGGGAASGYAPLVLLPVFWLAVHGTRRELVASFVAVGLVFLTPILVDSSRYPSTEWRRLLMWLIVTPIVALPAHDLVGHVRESARIDPLTGLLNRRAWNEGLQLLLRQSERSGQPLSVACLDLDGFKAYNDAHGHPAGDRLLTGAAAAWRGRLRAVDLLGRLGGDEFALLLPNASLEQAVGVVERATAATPEIRCSRGIVQWDGSESAEQLMARADGALYADKARQRAAR